jgi:hypothetical protein
MMNLIKELKIDIVKGLQFLFTVCKRGFMFSLALSLFIVFFCLKNILCKGEPCTDWIVFISAVIFLTTVFLYILDALSFIAKGIKLAWRFYRSKQREKAKLERLKDDKNRVTVALLK